jgi:hypothetical protein
MLSIIGRAKPMTMACRNGAGVRIGGRPRKPAGTGPLGC